MSILKNSIMFLKNVKYMWQHDIKEENRKMRYEVSEQAYDMYVYELTEDLKDIKKLNILNVNDTIDKLLENPISFCRFGDGEIDLINGNSIPFQKYDEKLKQTFLEIFRQKCDTMYVGLNYHYFHSLKGVNEVTKRFYRLYATKYRKFLLENCNQNVQYIAAGFNQVYQTYEDLDFDLFFSKVERLFSDKDIVLFHGVGILDKLQYNIFEKAHSVQYFTGPSRDAASEIESILKKVQKMDKKFTFCFILGPASKVIVYKLAMEGYRAWDIGHLAKDYDSYMRGEERTEENVISFYKPD